nr:MULTISPECIES: HAD family hydrolase [unclassified Burkholderia]
MTALTLLCDLDSTLIDTDALHLNAYNALRARCDLTIDIDYYKTHVTGFSDDLILGGLSPGMPAAEYTELAAERERLFRAQSGANLTPTAGTEGILGYAERGTAKTAVVTNAPRENATMILNALGLAERFGRLVTGGKLEHGMAHPLPYLTALELLGAKAENAVAFEDLASGHARRVRR